MRITDHRYDRDLSRLRLALRMIRHEARTRTIRLCTGLTDDRIRKLHRSYFAQEPDPVRRRRGKSPAQPAYFTRNVHTQLESSLLAGIFATVGLLATQRASSWSRIEFAERFCEAYETYQDLWRGRELSFEHGWYLLRALSVSRELRLEPCLRCRAPYVRDPCGGPGARPCPLCRVKTSRACSSSTPVGAPR